MENGGWESEEVNVEAEVVPPENNVGIDSTISSEPYNYGEYNIIKLLHVATNEIEEIPFDEYLYGVVAAEMPASFEIEALKAQAVVARTYTIYKSKHNNGKHTNSTVCDSHLCCQEWMSKEERYEKWGNSVDKDSYWNKIVTAVNATKGKVITYKGEAINAFFHANSGGMTELPINVWGGSETYPYLQAVVTSGESGYTQYNSEVELSKEEIVSKIKETHKDIVIDWNVEKPVEIVEYTDSNRIKTIRFGNTNLSGVEARTIFGLKSTNFTFEISGDKVKFKVIGYGHGVGMSQTGADAFAKQGKNYMDIVNHFYIGIEVVSY